MVLCVSYARSVCQKTTRNMSKVHGYPRLAPLVDNWSISNLATFTNILMSTIMTIGRNRKIIHFQNRLIMKYRSMAYISLNQMAHITLNQYQKNEGCSSNSIQDHCTMKYRSCTDLNIFVGQSKFVSH